MTASVKLIELIEFTDWERSQWHDGLPRRGDSALAISTGPHGDSRINTVGELVRHIFVAEKHHVERLCNQPVSDVSAVPADSIEALFAFGARSRAALKKFVETNPAGNWDAPREFEILDSIIIATPRKFVMHILTHEIRHWAQIATLLRLNGRGGGFPDFLFGPAMGGGAKPRKA